jgi:hypothetical protein
MLLLAGVAYTQHQPAATSMVITSCSCGDMILMMGKNIARNM